MKKRILSMGLAMVLMISCLSGCGEKTDKGDNSGASGSASSGATDVAGDQSAGSLQNLIDTTKDTVKLQVWVDDDVEVTKKMTDAFAKEYGEKGVKFDISVLPNSESMSGDAVTSGEEDAPDVFKMSGDMLNELIDANGLSKVDKTYLYDVKSVNSPGAVMAVSKGDTLYAYPMSIDSGYFLFYDNSVIPDEKASSMTDLCEAANAAGKKVAMIVADAWYDYSFFKAAGLDAGLDEDGLTSTCNWNDPAGVDVAQAIIDLGKTAGFEAPKDDPKLVKGVKNGDYVAVVSGFWNAELFQKKWKDGFRASKLPTFNVAGEEKQMWSFADYKMLGVNPHSKFAGWAMLLAEYMTSEENQVLRFKEIGVCPTNPKASESAGLDETMSALAAQSEFSVPQRVGGNYWDPARELGVTLIEGNPDGTPLQELLDNAVSAITEPIEG